MSREIELRLLVNTDCIVVIDKQTHSFSIEEG